MKLERIQHEKALCYLRGGQTMCGLNGVNGFCQSSPHLLLMSSFAQPSVLHSHSHITFHSFPLYTSISDFGQWVTR